MLVQKNIVLFAGYFWMPSRCQNWVRDGLLESYGSIIYKYFLVFSFGINLVVQNMTIPTLVKMVNPGAEILP